VLKIFYHGHAHSLYFLGIFGCVQICVSDRFGREGEMERERSS